MKYDRFEDLPVWKDAIELAVQVYALTADDAFKGQASLRDQLERAAVSVSNNIAEGLERGTTQELITSPYIARGSAGEVRSMLLLLNRMPKFSDLKSQISDPAPKAFHVNYAPGLIAFKIPRSKANATSSKKHGKTMNARKSAKWRWTNCVKCGRN